MEFTTYNELITYFKTPRPDYWETLLLNHSLILKQLNISNQGIIAKDLHITQPHLSTTVKLLRAYQSLQLVKVA